MELELYKLAALEWLEDNGLTGKRMRVGNGTASNPVSVIGYCVNVREINCHLNMYAKRFNLALPSWLTGEVPDCGS